jgi:hypothetical protein
MLKIKTQENQLIITNEGEVSVMDISKVETAHKAIQTLSKALEQAVRSNVELQKTAYLEETPETFDIAGTEPLLRDVTMNVPSHVTKNIKSAMTFAPNHLQSQVVKNTVNALAQVYKDAGEMVLNCSDTTLLSKSLFQKSLLIKRDLELLEEQLDAPLNQIKAIKMEKQMRKDVLSKGIEQGKLIAKNQGYFGIDQDTLEIAAALNKTKSVLKEEAISQETAIANAFAVLNK